MINTTVAYLLNGDTVDVEGNAAVITEIIYMNEPLVRLIVHTERFGRMSIMTTDDAPITIIEKG